MEGGVVVASGRRTSFDDKRAGFDGKESGAAPSL